MNKKGFTLIELLAVIVILGIIMALAIPEVIGYINKAKRDSLGDAVDFFRDGVSLETSMSGNNELDGVYTIINGIIIEENPFTFNKKLSFDGTFTIDNDNLFYTFYNKDDICVSKKTNENKEEFGIYKDSNCIYDNVSNDNSDLLIFEPNYNIIVGYKSYEYQVDETICVDYIKNDSFYSEFLGSDQNKLEKFCNGEKVLLDDGTSSFIDDIDFYVYGWKSIDYLEGEGFLTRLGETSRDVVIPSQINGVDVLEIFNRAFMGVNLTSIIIPDSVINIGDYAFMNNKLTNISIPSSVTSIGIAAFNNNLLPDDKAFISNPSNSNILLSYGGAKKDNVIVPSSFTSIGSYSFFGNFVRSVTIPNTITRIESNAFQENELSTINIPTSVTYVGRRAFSSNFLTEVVLPNSVTYLGDGAFFENNLSDITLSSSITSIGNYVFANNSLTNVVIPSNITSIGDEAFRTNSITSVTIPNSVTSIGKQAFFDNQLLTLDIPNSIVTIEDFAFRSNKLTSLVIPSSVTSIGISSFSHNNLVNVTIPSSVTSIGSWAFFKDEYSNTTLTSIIYKGTTPQDWVDIVHGYNSGTPFVTGAVNSSPANVTISAN